ncbi:hypothetical protein [Algoriphagus formosus]|uniref:hypothetical protein n=1 Tax=Algoriphagus formosus TaxID=2007308 RepID=UPI003F71A945
MKLFSLSELNPPEPVQAGDRSEVLRAKFVRKHEAKIESLKKLAGKIPEPGEAVFLFTLKSFNAFTFIVYVIKHVGEIQELCLSTYSLNERILTSMLKWYDKGQIKRIRLSISDSIRHRMPKVYDLIELQRQSRDFTVNYCWNHSKITLMQSGGHHFVVEGSGNFSENALHEQYIWMNDPQVYAFRKSCICPSEPSSEH